MTRTAALAVALDQHQDAVIETILAFDVPKGHWLIQRPDGQFFAGWASDGSRTFTPRAEQAAACQTETGAQHLIDIHLGSEAGRTALRDCTPVCVGAL